MKTIKNKRVYLLLPVVFVLFLYLFFNFFTKSQISGVFVNTNYNHGGMLAESRIPYEADTLVLLTDGTFTSGFYGNGFYSQEYSFKGTRIVLITTDTPSESEAYRSVLIPDRSVFGDTRIMFIRDLNHHYLKIR